MNTTPVCCSFCGKWLNNQKKCKPEYRMEVAMTEKCRAFKPCRFYSEAAKFVFTAEHKS